MRLCESRSVLMRGTRCTSGDQSHRVSSKICGRIACSSGVVHGMGSSVQCERHGSAEQFGIKVVM